MVLRRCFLAGRPIIKIFILYISKNKFTYDIHFIKKIRRYLIMSFYSAEMIEFCWNGIYCQKIQQNCANFQKMCIRLTCTILWDNKVASNGKIWNKFYLLRLMVRFFLLSPLFFLFVFLIKHLIVKPCMLNLIQEDLYQKITLFNNKYF